MQLRLAAGYASLAVALGVACGGRTVNAGSPGERVQGEGGASDSSAGAPADSASSDGYPSFDPSPAFPPPASGSCECCSTGHCNCPASCPPPTAPSSSGIATGGGLPMGSDPAAQCQLCCSGKGGCTPSCACPIGPPDAGGQSDAAQAGACDAGCACFVSESVCTLWGCAWHGGSCTKGFVSDAAFDPGGSPNYTPP